MAAMPHQRNFTSKAVVLRGGEGCDIPHNFAAKCYRPLAETGLKTVAKPLVLLLAHGLTDRKLSLVLGHSWYPLTLVYRQRAMGTYYLEPIPTGRLEEFECHR